MKRRSFIQGALLAIPLIACKRLPAIAEEVPFDPFASQAAEALPGARICEKLSDFDRFRAAAKDCVEVSGPYRGMFHLRINIMGGMPTSLNSHDLHYASRGRVWTYENYFDAGDDIEKAKTGFISSAYQSYTKHAYI